MSQREMEEREMSDDKNPAVCSKTGGSSCTHSHRQLNRQSLTNTHTQSQQNMSTGILSQLGDITKAGMDILTLY